MLEDRPDPTRGGRAGWSPSPGPVRPDPVGRVTVLSIGKVRLAGEGYYLNAVADGVDEYYRGVGEAPGRWTGSAAPDLGLAREVSAEDLAAVWAGQDPRAGEQLGRFVGREIAGFDLTFRPAKSVSLLGLLGDDETRAAVRDAHEAAVDAALADVEREAARSRTGRNGIHEIEVEGLIAAAFRHRTSRAGDPHLHTHVLVANMARGVDGTWRTLDGRQLYLHAKTAGYLYEAHLRHELTRRLGVEWAPVRNGTAEIDGIPRAVVRHFSDRRRQIEEHLDQTGFRSARAAELAALETRQAKREPGDARTMVELWTAKAAEIGWDPTALRDLLGRVPIEVPEQIGRSGEVPALVPALVPSQLFAQLLAPDGLTAQSSTFDRRDVLRAVAERAPRGATVDQIAALAEEFLSHPEVVALRGGPDPARSAAIHRSDGAAIPTTRQRCYSTRELIELETRLVAQAVTRRNSGVGVAPVEYVEGRVGGDRLSVEQADMVRRLCRSGNGIEVVTAAAGTGKTYTLATANLIWADSGHHVIGAAVAGIAARELQDAAGIPSTTIARLLIDLQQGTTRIDERTVLVIDEAGMAGTRTLAPILDAAHHTGAKVVLVGDPRQLPEIDAGGLLAGIARRVEPIQLLENRRQRAEWERHALAELRHGDTTRAVAAYQEHNRIVTARTAPILRQRLVDDWWDLYSQNPSTVMLAYRRSDVDQLNGHARAHLQNAGRLTGPELVIKDRPFQAGDQIVCLRNDRRLGIHNGTRATITHINPDQRTLTIRTKHHSVMLPARYLDAGHIAHGYATTIHKSQGATVDHALILGNDELTRERGYVALSRGRHTNRIYITGEFPDGVQLTHGPPDPTRAPHLILGQALHHSTAKELAIDTSQAGSDPPRGCDQTDHLPAVDLDIADDLF